MSETVHVLAIAGSLRRGSYNRMAVRAAQELAPHGVEIEVFDLDGIPAYNQDEEKQPPEKVVELKQRIRDADAILFATPEYNYSVPGVLKNAIDWASRPHGDNAWEGKVAAILGASIGTGGTMRAQYHLRQIFVYLDVHALNRPEVMIGKAAERFDAAGRLTDETSRKLIGELLSNLRDAVLRDHGLLPARAPVQGEGDRRAARH